MTKGLDVKLFFDCTPRRELHGRGFLYADLTCWRARHVCRRRGRSCGGRLPSVDSLVSDGQGSGKGHPAPFREIEPPAPATRPPQVLRDAHGRIPHLRVIEARRIPLAVRLVRLVGDGPVAPEQLETTGRSAPTRLAAHDRPSNSSPCACPQSMDGDERPLLCRAAKADIQPSIAVMEITQHRG